MMLILDLTGTSLTPVERVMDDFEYTVANTKMTIQVEIPEPVDGGLAKIIARSTAIRQTSKHFVLFNFSANRELTMLNKHGFYSAAEKLGYTAYGVNGGFEGLTPSMYSHSEAVGVMSALFKRLGLEGVLSKTTIVIGHKALCPLIDYLNRNKVERVIVFNAHSCIRNVKDINTPVLWIDNKAGTENIDVPDSELPEYNHLSYKNITDMLPYGVKDTRAWMYQKANLFQTVMEQALTNQEIQFTDNNMVESEGEEEEEASVPEASAEVVVDEDVVEAPDVL